MIYLELKKSKQMTEKIGFFNICHVIDDVFLTLDTYTGGGPGKPLSFAITRMRSQNY